MDVGRIRRSRAAEWSLALGLALTLSGSSGCCVINRLANVLSHAHENRSTCQFPAPIVAVAAPQGYLDQGPTVSGEIIAGPPGKTALDVVVDLQNEVVSLTTQRDKLQSQLQQAEEIIRQQEEGLGAATQELQQSASDLSSMRQRLTVWQDELAEISQHYLEAQTQQDEVVAQMEQRLRGILAECEASRKTLNVSQPAAPSSAPEPAATDPIPSP